MRALQTRHLECVQVLLDNGAKVNMQTKVICVIIHCVHAIQHVPRIPSSGSSTLYFWLGTEEWNLCGDQDLCLLEHGNLFVTSSVY